MVLQLSSSKLKKHTHAFWMIWCHRFWCAWFWCACFSKILGTTQEAVGPVSRLWTNPPRLAAFDMICFNYRFDTRADRCSHMNVKSMWLFFFVFCLFPYVAYSAHLEVVGLHSKHRFWIIAIATPLRFLFATAATTQNMYLPISYKRMLVKITKRCTCARPLSRTCGSAKHYNMYIFDGKAVLWYRVYSLEAYPFGRVAEIRKGEDPELPLDVQGRSLRFANYHYPGAYYPTIKWVRKKRWPWYCVL